MMVLVRATFRLGLGSVALVTMEDRVCRLRVEPDIAAVRVDLSQMVAKHVELIANLLPALRPHGLFENDRGAGLGIRSRFKCGKGGAGEIHGQAHWREELVLGDATCELLCAHGFGACAAAWLGR
jgi:hypothetical protein